MSGFAASKAQRAKVRFSLCLSCGQPNCDPAHVIPRAQGGCDDPMCVVPLCRTCHTDYDTGNLDLLPALEALARPELAHALMHVGLERLRRRVTNQRQHPEAA